MRGAQRVRTVRAIGRADVHAIRFGHAGQPALRIAATPVRRRAAAALLRGIRARHM